MRPKRSATIDAIMALGPCRSRKEVTAIFNGKKRMSLAHLERLPIEALSYADRVWVLLHEMFLPVPATHLLACQFAERALRRERNAGRELDPRSWAAIRVKRQWAAGKATDEQLDAAESAAWSAARSAARSAAESAARSAARSAAESAAWSAAESAAEYRFQYRAILRDLRPSPRTL